MTKYKEKVVLTPNTADPQVKQTENVFMPVSSPLLVKRGRSAREWLYTAIYKKQASKTLSFWIVITVTCSLQAIWVLQN